MSLGLAIEPGGTTFSHATGLSFFPRAFAANSPPMNAVTIKDNKWVRRAVVALAVLFTLWAIAWVAVPPILKSQVQKIASEKLGRQVTIGEVSFKPWTLELTVNDLRIASADGSHSQVDIGRLYADAELQSILRLAPVVDAITVERPKLKVVRNKDGSYDFDDILKRLASEPEKPKSEPARFAIYNIQVSGGEADFDDQAIGPKHELRDLKLGIPFLSSFASQRDVKVQPKLAFKLNGSAFDSDAEATPFAEARAADGRLRITDLDLSGFLKYAPRDQLAKLAGGKLDADLKVDFRQGAAEGLIISGQVEFRDAKLLDARDKDLLAFESLKLGLANVRPLEGIVHLSEVAIKAPNLAVTRHANGRLNLQPVDPAESAGKPAEMSRPVAEAAKGAAEKKAWKVQVDKIGLQAGKVGWRDETLAPAAVVELGQLEFHAEGVAWPMEKPATFNGSTALGGGAVKFKGEATNKQAKVETEIGELPLTVVAPYLAQQLEPTLNGKLAGRIDLTWNNPELLVNVVQFSADGLALTQGKAPLASIGRLEVADAKVDLAKRTVSVANLSLSKPQVKVERGSDKRWMFEQWRKTAVASNGSAPAGAAKGNGKGNGNGNRGADNRPWQVSLASLAVDGGVVGFSDKANEKTPVEVEINSLGVKAQQLTLDGTKASPIEVSGRISSGRRTDPGRFSYKGKIALKPMATDGQVDLNALPVHAFKAYFAEQVPNVDLRRFYLSYRGNVQYAADTAGPKVSLAGDTAMEDVRVNSALLAQAGGLRESGASRLLSWKSLTLRGVKFDLVPKKPFSLDVRETTLVDLFARLVIDETGTLHLQDLASREPIDIGKPAAAGAEGQKPTQPADTRKKVFGRGTVTKSPQPVAPAGRSAPAELLVAGEPAPQAAQPTPAAAPADAGPKPTINFGPITLVNARIDFNDRFVKPNYSADLSELTGKLSAFSSQPVNGKAVLADLELRGKAQQTASLEIVGKLNPLVKPLELDITAKMRDLELAPLSPYSGRYVGYGIERGKMSVDVNYKIEPDGRLTATNKLVLNQLTFSEQQVPGAERTLPVKLAMALLSDRNGVVDIDLPLSGSINDPQFSLAPLIWKGIVNLIVKAVTSPVALFTGGGGGSGGESNTIVFNAGSSDLTPQAKESLDKVAKALNERPSLRMTVVGTSDLEKERSAYQRERLRDMAQAEKRREAARAGKPADQVSPVTDAEYPELITSVYKRADFSKPRNMVGLTRSLPVKEMEDLLIANMTVNEESIRDLAVERGVVVRDYLLEQKLPAERLFLGAVSTKAGSNDWKPGAELKLDSR